MNFRNISNFMLTAGLEKKDITIQAKGWVK